MGERLARLILVVVGATLVTFLLLRLAGDPANVLLPVFATPEQRQELREDLGLDRSLPEQYLAYVKKAAVGDLGESWKYRTSASELVLSRFPATLELVAAGVGLALVLAIALALLSSTRPGGVFDGLFLVFSL
ncbi:MAG: ABC transporter permease, partial [Acidimicrobiia bacterium]